MNISKVDICCGLNWGDEAKGKLVAHLVKNNHYDYVCRWAGGNNAGHTIYVEGKKYKTHLIPSGIFYNVKSIIGPDCVVNPDSFMRELDYLRENGFDTSLIKISPKAHIVTEKHIEEDKEKYKDQGTTSNGIAPCYKDKYGRKGIRAENVDSLKDYLWNEVLDGNVLCEGAQGFWLDINYGNYPFVTSSTTLPYGACCLGFPPQKIDKIYGASKIYDTRSGTDPLFPETLLEDPELMSIVKEGCEIGTTTGRIRKTNWLNLDKLLVAINISGVTDIIISKIDVLENVGLYKLYHNDELLSFENMEDMQTHINKYISGTCKYVNTISYSGKVEGI
jgi:adenylosuccinate synthase